MGFRWTVSDASISAGFLRIAREQIGKAIATARDTGEPSSRRVHAARRHGKKLRALLRLVRSDFRAYEAANAVIRDAARELSAARDNRVMHQALVDLLVWAGREPLARPEPQTNSEAEEAMLATFAARLDALLAETDRWPIARIDAATLSRGVTATYRSGRRAAARVARHPTDTGFHDWRKHAKYHWSQLRLLQSFASDVLPSEHAAAGELAELLGQHHDLAVLRETAEDDPGQFPGTDPGFIAETAPRRQRDLETRISALGAQVFAEKPAALHDRFAAYVEDWQQRRAAH